MFCIAALRPRTLGAVASLVAALCTTVQAAPTIANISPRGLQIGEPTTLTITGSGFSLARNAAPLLSSDVRGERAGDSRSREPDSPCHPRRVSTLR